MDGLKAGNEALKKVNEMMSIEDVERILEETREGVEKQKVSYINKFKNIICWKQHNLQLHVVMYFKYLFVQISHVCHTNGFSNVEKTYLYQYICFLNLSNFSKCYQIFINIYTQLPAKIIQV